MEGTGGLVNGIRPPTADLPGLDHRFHLRDHAEPGMCVCVCVWLCSPKGRICPFSWATG